MSDDQVGYKKPPLHTRFRKGKSGNPNGRPKGEKNLMRAFEKRLGSRIKVRDSEGNTRTVTVAEAIVLKYTQVGLSGNPNALKNISSLARELQGLADNTTEATLPPDDQAMLERRLRKLAQQMATKSPAGPQPTRAGRLIVTVKAPGKK